MLCSFKCRAEPVNDLIFAASAGVAVCGRNTAGTLQLPESIKNQLE
jgi:hypothetical protein